MAIVGGFDVHRAQITFDYVDTDSGQVTAGQIRPATRPALRNWLQRFEGRDDVAFAVEGCTGWRFVVEELARARVEPHLDERLTRPTCVAARRGRKRIVLTRACCASCWLSTAYPSPGYRPVMGLRSAPWVGCT